MYYALICKDEILGITKASSKKAVRDKLGLMYKKDTKPCECIIATAEFFPGVGTPIEIIPIRMILSNETLMKQQGQGLSLKG